MVLLGACGGGSDDTQGGAGGDKTTAPDNWVDADGDGWPAQGPEASEDLVDPPPYDCDDNDPSVHPWQDEVPYNGKDDDCIWDTLDDDFDQDGACLYPEQGFANTDLGAPPTTCLMAEADCDDTDPVRTPGAVDVCGDRVDQDCDGLDLRCVRTGELGFETGGTVLLSESWDGFLDGVTTLVPDVDGDGRDDLLIVEPATGQHYFGLVPERMAPPGVDPTDLPLGALPADGTFSIGEVSRLQWSEAELLAAFAAVDPDTSLAVSDAYTFGRRYIGGSAALGRHVQSELHAPGTNLVSSGDMGGPEGSELILPFVFQRYDENGRVAASGLRLGVFGLPTTTTPDPELIAWRDFETDLLVYGGDVEAPFVLPLRAELTDVTGDGVADLVVAGVEMSTAWSNNVGDAEDFETSTWAGIVQVWSAPLEGASDTPGALTDPPTLEGTQPQPLVDMDAGCDFSGDGVADIVVGQVPAVRWDADQPEAVHVLTATDGSLAPYAKIDQTASTIARFGLSVAAECSGSGPARLAVAAPVRTPDPFDVQEAFEYGLGVLESGWHGQAWVFELAADLAPTAALTPDDAVVEIQGSLYDHQIAREMAWVGDPDGDGVPLLAAGSTCHAGIEQGEPRLCAGIGGAWMFPAEGDAFGTVSDPGEGLDPPQVWVRGGGTVSEVGHDLGPAGDVNGDGYDDFVVSAASRVLLIYGGEAAP